MRDRRPPGAVAGDRGRRGGRLGRRRAQLPGFDGRPGFKAPDDYLGWLTAFWDALDATGALPCPVIGASVGGMIAADLAALRPEAVTALGLLAPFGIGDAANPGFDLYAVPGPERMGHLFAKGVPEPFADRFGELGPDERPGRPLPLRHRRGQPRVAARRPRPGQPPAPAACPRLALWGDQDELLPVGTSAAWAAGGVPVEVVAGAGHLLEWDAPDEVGARLVQFLATN